MRTAEQTVAARRAQLEREAVATIATGRDKLRRALRRCANCRGAAMCERWCPEYVEE